jgi:hypothetical protein
MLTLESLQHLGEGICGTAAGEGEWPMMLAQLRDDGGGGTTRLSGQRVVMTLSKCANSLRLEV